MKNGEFTPITLGNLSYNDEFIKSWDFVGNDTWRLYFRKDTEEGCGFEFACVEWVSGESIEDLWNDRTEVMFLFNGIAYFDGIRHMYLGTHQDEIFGYVNYPNLNDLIEILKAIRNLELLYCRDCYTY